MGTVISKLKKQSIPQLIKIARNSEYLKNAAKLTGGTALAQIIMIVTSPLLSRLYSPADFGNFALYNSCVTVLLILCTGRYDIGIVSSKLRKEALGLLSLSFLILLLVLIISSLTLVLFKEWITTLFFDGKQLDDVIFLIPVTVLFLGAYQILSYWFNREKQYNKIALSKVAQNTSNILLAIAIGFFFHWGLGLIAGHIFGAIVAVVFLLIKNALPLSEIKEVLNKYSLKAYASKFGDFPKYSLPTAFLDTFSLQIPIFLIVYYFNETVAGHFSFAYRILSIPIAFIGVSLGQVFYQKLSEIYFNEQDCKGFVLKMWGSLFLLGILPFTILLAFGEEIFSLVFGESWSDAGKIASILAIPLFFMFCSSPTSTAFIVFGIQRYSLIFGLLSVVLRPLAFYIGNLKGDIYTGLIYWGLFEILAIVLYNIVLIKHAKKKS